MRTGRANLAMLDGVRVDYYGTPTPLNQVASLAVADARLITVKPWEKSLIPEIEKAIRAAQLGLNPQSRRRAGAPADAGAHRRSGARSWSRWSRRWPRSARSPSATRAATPTRCSRKRSRTRRSPRTTSARACKSVQETTDKARHEGRRDHRQEGSRDPRGLRPCPSSFAKRTPPPTRSSSTANGSCWRTPARRR